MSSDQSWGSRSDGTRSYRTFPNMSRDRRPRPPKDAQAHLLRCAFCASSDVDEDARECRSCRTVIPVGVNLRPDPNPTSATREWRRTTAVLRQADARSSASTWRR